MAVITATIVLGIIVISLAYLKVKEREDQTPALKPIRIDEKNNRRQR